MTALQVRRQPGCSPEVWLDGGWVALSDVLLVARVLTDGRNPLLDDRLQALREECASDLETLICFWACPIDADSARH